MRLLAHLVARDEADRYLSSVLAALPTEHVHLYDDQSTDDTAALAFSMGAEVRVRPNRVPTFMEHEGAFRQAAWNSMVDTLKPEPGDWVLALDCDEIVVSDGGDVPDAIQEAILAAQEGGSVAVLLPIPEVWKLDDHGPWQRVDGYWAGLRAPRLFAYRAVGEFNQARLGCGSVPLYAVEGHLSRHTYGLAIAHLGYADPSDRAHKYRRYAGRPGHSPKHVSSILTGARLARAGFTLPPVTRGAR
jgi:hypothetical protein